MTELVQTQVSRRVLKRIGDAVKAGKAVDFRHERAESGDVYDTISAAIED